MLPDGLMVGLFITNNIPLRMQSMQVFFEVGFIEGFFCSGKWKCSKINLKIVLLEE